jgi:hypothetical protein
LTSSVSNAAAIFDRHVSTIDVSAPAGDDIHLVEAPTWDLATSLLLWMVNERAKDDNMMHEMIGWTAFMVWCADADVRRLHRCWQLAGVGGGGGWVQFALFFNYSRKYFLFFNGNLRENTKVITRDLASPLPATERRPPATPPQQSQQPSTNEQRRRHPPPS